MQTFCAAESNPPAHSLSAVIHSVAAGEWPGFGARGLSGLLATHPMEGVVGYRRQRGNPLYRVAEQR